jgi:protein TonB
MFSAPKVRTWKTGRIIWSVAVHAAVLAWIFAPNRDIRVRESLPGTLLGDRMQLTYLPGGESASVPSRRKSLNSKLAPKTPDPAKTSAPRPPIPAPPPAVSAAAQESAKTSPAPSSGQAGAASNDALGTDDIQIALTTYSPSPAPDLSQVPRGKQGDVIIDITIDPAGKVADLQILQALGYGVDGNVADVVRTWQFHPAMKDGVPVASVQELRFHFGPV